MTARRRAGALLRTGMLAVALVATASAQRPPLRTVEAPIDFSAGQDDNLFSVVRSQEQIHEFEQGLADVAAGELRAGVERLHRVLQGDAAGVVPVAPGRFLGLRLCVTQALANLPPAARAAYEELVAREGGGATDLAALDAEALRALADRFPAADVGLRARLRLGDLALADGDARTAAGRFRQALDAAAIGSDEERRAAERLYCAQTLLEPAHALGLRRQGRLAASGDDALGALPPARLLRQDWPAVGGPGSGAAAMASPPRRIDTRWSAEVGAPGFDERLISQYAMHAVGDLDGVYVATGQQVVAFDPLRKETLWASIAPMREVGEEPAAPQGFGRRRRGGDDGINEDMTLAAAVGDDVVVAALQVPEKSMNVDFQGGFRVMSKIPMRRLHGFARGSGKVLWAHYDELDGPRTRRYRGNDACGAPLVAGDLVYAPVHDRSGAIAFAIAAYDLRTGEQRWRRLICSSQQDVNMFGNARAEFAASPLALHQGVLYGASNLGVAFAVDAATGALRWLSSYDVVRMPRVSFHQQAERQVYFANNPPAVTDGVVCMTPLDSQFVLGFDAESGRVLWRAPAEATVGDVEHRVFWLVGAWPGEFVLAGAGVLAVKARPAAMLRGAAEARSVVAPEGFADNLGPGLAPRPGLAADALWFVRNDGLHGVGENGAPLPGTPIPLGRLAPGNFVALDGIAVSLRQGAIDFAYDAAALRTRVEDEARARADDPAVLLRLASLRRSLLAADASREQRAAVQQTYRLGLDAAIARGLPPEHPVRAALQRELFAQAVASAAIAANAGRADALELAVAARDLAPDDDRWADSHAIVLDLCRGDAARLAAELDRLLARMPDGSCPRIALPLPKGRAIADGDRMPVATFVAWQRALLPADPAVACLRWQQLLEAHGDTDLVGGAAAAVARAAIDELVRRHGSGCYEAIEQQAAANLKAAGDAPGFLRELAARYPNSAAAATARVRLLDAAVRAGDLGAALAALTPTAAAGEPSPGTLRRVQVAALARGNRGLAAALAQRLARHASVRSDWPDDQGATLGDVAAVALAPTAPPALEVPQRDVVALRPPNGADVLMLTPTLAPEGFAPPTAALLPCRAERELLLIDPAAAGGKAVRQAAPIEFVEHVVQCGDTLVVPDMERVFALDARSGAELWQLPNPQRRLLESLGVAQGVLLVVALPRAAEGEGELVGVEPLTGAVLFRRNLPAGALKPKAVADAVLAMEFDADGAAVVRRIDPVTGAVTASWPLVGARRQLPLSLESLSTRFYPQSMVVHGDLLLLPVDKSLSGEAATVLALRPDGGIAWQWQGPKDAQLQCVAAREQCLVALAVDAEGQGRLACIDAASGKEVRTVPVGFDAEPHNWERSWLHAPAPERLLVHSFADADRTERQLVVVETGLAGTAFALPLAREDGGLVEGSAFGADFLAFATRSLGGSGCRLWCVSLQDRSGMLLEGRRTRTVRSVGNVDAMTRCGDRIALAGARGVLLLGVERGPR